MSQWVTARLGLTGTFPQSPHILSQNMSVTAYKHILIKPSMRDLSGLKFCLCMNDKACGSGGWLCFHGKLRSTMQVTFSFYYSPIIYVHTNHTPYLKFFCTAPSNCVLFLFLYPPHPLIFEKHISRVVQEVTNLCSEYSEQFFWFWFQRRKLLLCKFQGRGGIQEPEMQSK